MKQIKFFLLTALLSMVGARAIAHNIEVKNADGVTIYYNWANNQTELSVSYRGTDYYYSDRYTGNVVIPESVAYNGKTYPVTSIGNYAFAYCSGLTSVTIPNSVTSIDNGAFAYCSGLTSVTIPNSVTSIVNSAFSGCSGLTSVTIPNSVTSIDDGAFAYCSGLTSVTIPNSVTSIGSNAFLGCSGLTSITIPNSVTSISRSAFSGCYFARENFVNNSTLSSDNNWGATLGDETEDGLLINNNSVVKCRKWATSVSIPNSVTSIGYQAFDGCSGLTSVTIPNSVTIIGSSAFSGCFGLTSVTIPNSVTRIGDGAFQYCSGLTSVTIPNSVTSIGSYAFRGCSGLTSVTISNSVTRIGDSAFSGCYFARENFVNNSTLSSDNNWGATLGDETEDGLLINNNSVVKCRKWATSVSIPNSVTSIGNYALAYCSGLTSVTIPNSVTSIGDAAFFDCSALTSVTIGNSVTTIGGSAFSGCSGLTSVTIPNSVTSIGSYAFQYCSGLTSVTIGNSVTSIGNKAFSDCTGLTSVTCQSTTPPTLGDGGFSDYTIPLYVPKGSVLKYKAADNWRNFVIIREISEEQDVYLSILQMNGAVKLKVDAEKPYFNLQIQADEGWKIHSVMLNEEDVTAEVASDGSYTTPVISSNSTLNVVFEKGSSNIANMTESPLRVNAYSGAIRISGAETGEKIAVYSADGKIVKSVNAEHGTATITLPENQTYIVKGRQKTVKVRL